MVTHASCVFIVLSEVPIQALLSNNAGQIVDRVNVPILIICTPRGNLEGFWKSLITIIAPNCSIG